MGSTRNFARPRAERDALTARVNDSSTQLESAFAQIESLRRQLRAATVEITGDNVDAKVREIIDAAHASAVKARAEGDAYLQQMRLVADDAAERRRTTARAEADEILAAATRRLAEADEAFRARIAEADRYRAEIQEQADRAVAAAHDQENKLTTEAAAERQRLDDAGQGRARSAGRRERRQDRRLDGRVGRSGRNRRA